MVRRRSSSAALNEPTLVSSESSASASSRSTVSGVRSRCDRSATSSRSSVRSGDQPVGHPVEGVPRLGQFAGTAGFDPYREVAVADRLGGLDQPRVARHRPGREPVHHDHGGRPPARARPRTRISQVPPVPAVRAASVTKTSITATRPSTGTGSSRTTPPETSATTGEPPRTARSTSAAPARGATSGGQAVHDRRVAALTPAASIARPSAAGSVLTVSAPGPRRCAGPRRRAPPGGRPAAGPSRAG